MAIYAIIAGVPDPFAVASSGLRLVDIEEIHAVPDLRRLALTPGVKMPEPMLCFRWPNRPKLDGVEMSLWLRMWTVKQLDDWWAEHNPRVA